MKVEYSMQAVDDLWHMEQHYAERASSEVAKALVQRITSTLERLIARHPRTGRVRPELGPETRSFPVLPYVVFYRIAPGRIFVERILHGHRDIRSPLASLLLAV